MAHTRKRMPTLVSRIAARSRVAFALLIATATAGLAVACGSSSSAGDSGSQGDASPAASDGPSGSDSPAGNGDSSAPTDGGMKSPMLGFIDMGLTQFDDRADGGITDVPQEMAPFAASFGGIVINLTWKDLQPTSGAALAPNNVIDQELTMIRAYNAAHASSPITVKLRISGGFEAPDWAKSIGGAPLALSILKSTGTTESGTVGRWWTADYITAWRAFEAELAATYDSEPLIHEVAVTSCAAATDEPFVPVQQVAPLATLQGAGYNDAQQEACLLGALDDYSAWKQTWIDFTFNDFLSTDGKPTADPSFTISVMQKCTTANHCILATHYLDNPLAFKNDGGADQNVFVYAQIQTQESVSTADFQTASPNQLDWCGAMQNAHTYKGLSVEIWPDFGGFKSFTPAQVANLLVTFDTGTPTDAALCPPLPN